MAASDARAIEDLPERFNAAVDLLDHNLAAGRGGKAAVIDHRGATTYAALADRVDRMAEAFGKLGVAREQRVLLCLLDTVDFPTVFLGAIKAGVVPVPLNTLLLEDDYRWLLQDSGASAVFVTGDLAPHWQRLAAERPDVLFVSSEGGPWRSLDRLLADAMPTGTAADTHRDEPAFWLYTSGSTGRPKGVVHAHSSLRLTANLFGHGIVGYRSDDVVLSVAKLFFAYGLGNALTFPLAGGATAVLHRERATPAAISVLLRQWRVSILCGVPTFFAGWFVSDDLPERTEVPMLRIAVSAGECLPAHLGRAFRDRFGADIIDGLGSTEMLHIYLCQTPGAVRYGCTGRAVPGYRVRVVDAEGEPVATGETGELQVCGPTSPIGFWHNRPKSLTTLLGSWTRTGDNFVCDAEGWYTYAGRSDDMLKVGGIYVSPVEVENRLMAHPAVVEAAVVAGCDADGLVKPRAFVVVAAGFVTDVTLAAMLKEHVKMGLAPYKYPRWIEFIDALPKTATGKIQRFQLRDSA